MSYIIIILYSGAVGYNVIGVYRLLEFLPPYPLLDELFFILQNNLIPPPVLLFCIQETICKKNLN